MVTDINCNHVLCSNRKRQQLEMGEAAREEQRQQANIRERERTKQVRLYLTYRVTHQFVQNLPLISNQTFRFGLPRPGQTKTELLL